MYLLMRAHSDNQRCHFSSPSMALDALIASRGWARLTSGLPQKEPFQESERCWSIECLRRRVTLVVFLTILFIDLRVRA